MTKQRLRQIRIRLVKAENLAGYCEANGYEWPNHRARELIADLKALLAEAVEEPTRPHVRRKAAAGSSAPAGSATPPQS